MKPQVNPQVVAERTAEFLFGQKHKAASSKHKRKKRPLITVLSSSDHKDDGKNIQSAQVRIRSSKRVKENTKLTQSSRTGKNERIKP